MKTPLAPLGLTLAVIMSLMPYPAKPAEGSGPTPTLESAFLRFQISPSDGRYEITDKTARVIWRSHPTQPRFGQATLRVDGQSRPVNLDRGEVQRRDQSLEITFRPLAGQPDLALQVRVQLLPDGHTLEFSYQPGPGVHVETVRLLDHALWMTDAENGFAVVPVREGLLVPANSGKTFTHSFDTYAYEGCHMTMLGLCKEGAAALLTWQDPYLAAELESTLQPAADAGKRQQLAPSLILRKSARSFRIQFLGRGDYVAIARAYREVAKEHGWLVTWEEKLKTHPERAQLFGAINYKLWSVLSRQMNEASTEEERVRLNWTFDEAAQVAEHLKRDLQLDRVLFLMGGWIRRGYDNQHPDILPAAPECGGNDAFADCARRVRQLGYLFGLHDNYQDMYRDAPSWDESYLMRTPDGQLARGGRWAGGRAYLTCSKRAVELAQRPQNLPAVLDLTKADVYFIDTTYAAGLQECFDPDHPLARGDDMHWKQVLSDYARDLFGIFGSECGREWAIPHSDFFEGLTGVSGRFYHNAELPSKLGAHVVPLFELVYRDCIALYGKYGYDPSQAAEYVLHHLIIGRPLHYHSIPPHLYWKQTPTQPQPEPKPLGLQPGLAEVIQIDPRHFRIAYRWTVEQPPDLDWRVFVHFTDPSGRILFQNDHDPVPATAAWKPGPVQQGPYTVAIPEGLEGTFDVRMGLFRSASGPRARLQGLDDGERRYRVGQLRVTGDAIELQPLSGVPAGPSPDPGVFTRADNGWAADLHPLDRFVKNTYEILSPLNELTAQMQLIQHQFLSADRRVQRSVFGEGPEAVEVIVNGGTAPCRHSSKTGGEIVLPPYGFVVASPQFAAFHALSWGGRRYEAPVFFTLRSLDGQPLERSRRIRVFHGFGDTQILVGKNLRTVPRETVVEEVP